MITWDDPIERMDLIKVLSMLKQAEVPPFNKYEAEGIRRLVTRGCEVYDPNRSTTGLLVSDSEYEDRWKPYKEGLNTLGISFHQEEVTFTNGPESYYLIYITNEDGVEDKLLYWRDLLGGSWKGLK